MRVLTLFPAIILAIFLVGCDDVEKKQRNQYERAERDRIETFERAEKVIPVPKNENFPLRSALAEFTRRQDLINHPWYVYVLGDNGNPIGYFTAKTYPQNACNFLSRTDGSLPSLDGIYYGGGGASGACTAVFFFDNATNAMVVIDRLATFAVDIPLNLNVQPIKVEAR